MVTFYKNEYDSSQLSSLAEMCEYLVGELEARGHDMSMVRSAMFYGTESRIHKMVLSLCGSERWIASYCPEQDATTLNSAYTHEAYVVLARALHVNALWPAIILFTYKDGVWEFVKRIK